jgi:hypothetical protein
MIICKGGFKMGEEIKRLKGKISFKHETEADWAMSNYIPQNGELVLYDPDEKHEGTRLKRGDGVTTVSALPFIISEGLLKKGAGENSIINLVTDSSYRANEAVSDYSAALGVSNIAGSMAFNIVSYSAVDKTYTLSSALPEGIDFINEEFSIILPLVNRNRCGVITAIDSSRTVVTVSNMEIGGGWNSGNWGDSSKCYFKLINYPEVGDVKFGEGAFVSGIGNKSTSQGSFAAGKNNTAEGKYSIAAGKDNYAGWSSVALGARNDASGLGSFAIGLDNISKGMGAIAINQYNKALGQNSFVAGSNNISSYNNQTIVGNYNKENAESVFTVGNGTSDSDRRNAFEVLKDGRATISGNPINDNDITNKNYVDNQISNQDKLYFDKTITSNLADVKCNSDSSIEIISSSTNNISYVMYPANLLKKPISRTLTGTGVLQNNSSIVCNEYGVITIPADTRTNSTFYIYDYSSENGLFPFATSGKITIALHATNSYSNIQLWLLVYYKDASGNIISDASNAALRCPVQNRVVIDLDKYIITHGKIVGIKPILVWSGYSTVNNEFKLYPAIYRGEVDVNNINTIPESIDGNVSSINAINPNEKFKLYYTDNIETILFLEPTNTIEVDRKQQYVYDIIDDISLIQRSQVYAFSAGENIVFENNNGVLTINSTNTGSGLPTENKQAGAFLRLDSSLNPTWQIIPIAEEQTF